MWIVLSLLVAAMWGVQAFILKTANNTMRAESLVVYSMISALAISPFAVWMTDFSQPVNWSFDGPVLAAIIQLLNSIGFMTLVFAFRYGKAIIVSPMVNALPPVITVILSLILYQVIPHPVIVTGMLLAIVSAFLLAIEPE
jgi:drug/metabolite transporter (DMT)-like permease